MGKLLYVWLGIKLALCSCGYDRRINHFEKQGRDYKVTEIGKLPSVVDESSGLAKSGQRNTFWTHNDSGGKPQLFEIDSLGNLLSVKNISDAVNKDWEDLAAGENGAVFIGDFGNNGNTRKDLTIYKIAAGDSVSQKISFSYADQIEFPPTAERLNYDCEAFFYKEDTLYLFSKNRSKTNHFVRLYTLSAKPGNYNIAPTDSIQIKTQVTSADISPDGKKFALLTYGKVLIFGIGDQGVNFRSPIGCFRLVRKQAEAIVFLNNSDLMVTNEQGQIFRITHH